MLPPVVTEHTQSFFKRVSIAIRAFFRILGDAKYAARVLQFSGVPQLTEPHPIVGEAPVSPARDLRPALQLLCALQKEGRLVDFVQQDILAFSDADVGAAARVVHDGCRRALQRIVKFDPVHDTDEGHSVTVPAGYDATSLLLTGNVSGLPPFRGTLRHRGWRASGLTLPDMVSDADCTVVAPAEVEL